MIERYRNGVVPQARDESLDAAAAVNMAAYHRGLDGSQGYLLHESLKAVWQMVFRANEFVDRQAPWKLAKDPANDAELDRTLGALARELVRQCVLLAPFIPGKCDELWGMLGAPGSVHEVWFDALLSFDPAVWKVNNGEPLFPKEQKPASSTS